MCIRLILKIAASTGRPKNHSVQKVSLKNISMLSSSKSSTLKYLIIVCIYFIVTYTIHILIGLQCLDTVGSKGIWIVITRVSVC